MLKNISRMKKKMIKLYEIVILVQIDKKNLILLLDNWKGSINLTKGGK